MSKNEYYEGRRKKRNLFSLLFSFLTPMKVLFALHIKLLKKELKEDFLRYLKGILFLILSTLVFFIILILMNCFLIVIFKYFIFSRETSMNSLLFSILATIGINFLLFILFLTGVYLSFKKPFLKETMKAINDTLKNLG